MFTLLLLSMSATPEFKIRPADTTFKITAAPSPKPASKVVNAVSFRQPAGHTHTCPNCGDVWDHQKNSTHTCQKCGTQSWIQDDHPKAIPTVTSAPVVKKTTVPTFDPNCPDGNCPSQNYPLPRWRLFR